MFSRRLTDNSDQSTPLFDDHDVYNANIWDTAGLPKYRDIYPFMIREADAIVFVYDITRRESFEELDSLWEVVKEADAKTQFILVGNKLDLDKREVEFKEGSKYAAQHSMAFHEMSAKDDTNVSNVFDDLIVHLAKPVEKNIEFVRKRRPRKWYRRGIFRSNLCC